MKVQIISEQFRNEDGTLDKKRALLFGGLAAGICYDKEGFDHLKNEPEDVTMKRISGTLDRGHHSPYGNISISFEIQNIPKILAMVLNNEREYNTCEKSARYTPIERSEGSSITYDEARLYYKWLDLLKKKIQESYGEQFGKFKIRTLAQENARYFISVFMPTSMEYTTSFRQINYIASWMKKYIANANLSDEFQKKLSSSMQDFLYCLEQLNVLEAGLMVNDKSRSISLFGKDLFQREIHFGDVYSTKYYGSFAQFAQAQRHRSLKYQLEMQDHPTFFVPPIIEDNLFLVSEWLQDMNRVKKNHPQGEMVLIHEAGTYDNFILKCMERLCSSAQLEISNQTRETLLRYKEALKKSNSYLADDIERHSHGARCTFPEYHCFSDCHFAEGKTLTRKI